VASLALFAEIVPPTLACLDERTCDASHVAALDRVLAAEPRYVEGHVLRSKVLAQLGRGADAIAAMEAALRLNPEDTASLADLADLRAGAGDLVGALETLAAARSLSPAGGDLVTRQARLLRAAGRADEAASLLQDFVGAYPREPLARYELGCMLLQQGDVDAAEALIRAAFETAPGLDKVHFNLALIAEARGRGDAALQHYRDEIEARPENFEAWTNLGLLELERGAPEAAAEAARRVMALEPRLFAGPWLLAKALLASRGTADAELVALARRARELAPPGSPAARELLAELERAHRR
jgi:tetratricopeptide (TPR) repeat protein